MPNYTDIFSLLGAYARAYTSIRNFAELDVNVTQSGTTIRSLDNLAARFAGLLNDSATERDGLEVLATLQSMGTGLSAEWSSIRRSLDTAIESIIAEELGVKGNVASVLSELAREMSTDTESIQESTVGIGSPSPAASNIGDGVALFSIKRALADGTSVDSQLVRAQSISATCIEDSLLGGVEATRESWLVQTQSGLEASLQSVPVTNSLVEDDANHVLDASFAQWAGGSPSAWTLSGASLASQHTADSRFDASCLRINGNGQLTITQNIAPRSGAPLAGQMVALGVWVKVTSLSLGEIDIRLRTGAATLSHEVTVDTGTTTGSWLHLSAAAALPADAYAEGLRVEIVLSPNFNGDVLLDALSVTPMTLIGDGVSAAIFPGATPFVRAPVADRFTVATTNNEAGAFAAFLRDVLSTELPASSSPTISDSLAI